MKNKKTSRVAQRCSSKYVRQKREWGRLFWGRVLSYSASGRLLWSFVSLLCAIAGFVLWETLAEQEKARIEQKIITTGKTVKLELTHNLQEQILIVTSLSGLWEYPETEFTASAEQQGKPYAAKIQAIVDGKPWRYTSRKFVNSLLPEQIMPGYAIAIFDGQRQIYQRPQVAQPNEIEFVKSETIELHRLNWSLEILSKAKILSSERSPLPYVVLIAGIGMAGLLALVGHRSQTIRQINQKLAKEVEARAAAERSLQNLNRELEGRVEQSTAELKQATERLSTEIEARKIDEQALRESQVALMTINAIAEGIISGSRVEQLLEETVQLLGKRFPQLRVAYAAALPETDNALEPRVRLRVVHAINPPGMSEITELEFNLQIEADSPIARGQGEIIINNMAEEAVTPLAKELWDRKTGALLAVPLRDADERGHLVLRGLLWLEAPEPRQWTAYQVGTLAQIGEYLAIAMKESRARQDKIAAEAASRESDRRFRVIFHKTFQFMALLEPDGTILEINQTALDFTGYQLPEVKGCSLAQMPWWKKAEERNGGQGDLGTRGQVDLGTRGQFPIPNSQLQEAIDRAARGELVRDEVEIVAKGEGRRQKARDKADLADWVPNAQGPMPYTLDFSIKPVKNEVGQVVLLICEGRDITERKQAEKDLETYRHHLEELVEERAGELKKANQKLVAEINLRADLEEALLESEARLAGILDNADDAIISVDETQTITLFNKGAEKIFGYPAQEVLGQNLDIMLPLRFGLDRQHFEAFGKSSSPAQRMGERSEVFGRRKDGSEFPAEASISQLKLGDKKIFTAILRDISDRSRAEKALRESEERFRTVADFTYDWEYWLGEDGNLIYISPSCDRITGYSAAEFLANSELLKAIVHPEDAETFTKHNCAREVEEMVSAIDFRIITKSGEVRWLSHLCQSVFADGGRFLGRRASNRDITERQQALDALRESEERFRQIAETTREVFFTVSITGEEMVYISPAYELVWGRTCESLYRNPRSWLESVHPLDRQRVAAALDKQISDCVEFDEEYRILRPDGEIRWIRARSFPVENDLGEFYRFVGIAEDITERQQRSEALQQSEATNRALLEAIPDLIFQIRKDGTFLDFKAAKDFDTVVPPESFLGKKFSEVLPEALSKLGMQYIQKALSTGETQVFEYQLLEDGKLRNYEDRIVAISANRVLSIVRDITSRKQEEVEKSS